VTTSAASSRTPTCFFTPLSVSPNGAAISEIVAGPPESRSRIARRVGSESAKNVSSRVGVTAPIGAVKAKPADDSGEAKVAAVKGERVLRRGSDELKAAMAGVPRAFACCEAINRLAYADQDAIRTAWSELTGRPADERFRLVPPIHCDHGVDLRVGVNVFINHGCTLNDIGGIEIGDDTMLGPNVSLVTSGHPTPVAERRDGITVAPIAIGANVWIGAGATVLGGVTVGDGAVVAAGAVVTHDVPAATLVAGVPARALRSLG
jgi:acetyltransferase-like isoleucine patch superfamily enzyme